MRVIFISLLFSIILGNVLHAMGQEEQQAMVMDLDDRPDVSIEQQTFNIGERIATLADMEQLAKRVVLNKLQTRSRNGANFTEARDIEILDDIEIPDGVTIDPQVFIEYLESRNLTKESEPGWFKRIFYCRYKRSGRFEYHFQSDAREDWAKEMLLVLYNNQQGDSVEMTRGGRSDSLDDIEESDDSSAKEIKELTNRLNITECRLSIAEFQVARAKFQASFEQNIRSFNEGEQRAEDKMGELKKLGYAGLLMVIAFFSGRV